MASAYDMGNGNSFIGHALPELIGPMFDFWGYPQGSTATSSTSRKLDEAQLRDAQDRAADHRHAVPELQLPALPAAGPCPAPMPVPFTSIRVWQPVSPGVMELWN